MSTPPKWDQHTQLGAITFPMGQNVEDAMATSPIEQIQTHEQWNNPADVSSTEPMGSHTQKMLVDEALATRDLNTTSSKRPNGTDAPNLGTSDSSILWPALQSSSASWERQASQSMPIGTSEMQGLFAMGTQPKKRKNRSQTSTENICENANRNTSVEIDSHGSTHIHTSGVPTRKENGDLLRQSADSSSSIDQTDGLDAPKSDTRKLLHPSDPETMIEQEKGAEKPSYSLTTLPEQQQMNSDEVAIGLPPERYKPRPSRSRSARVTEEPLDLFVAPKKAARAKRRKTTDAATESALNSSSLTANLAIITSMGFSHSQSEQVLRELDGDVEQTIDRLCNQLHERPANAESREGCASQFSSRPVKADALKAPPDASPTELIPPPLGNGPPDATPDDLCADFSEEKTGKSLLRVEITSGKERKLSESRSPCKGNSKKAKRRKTTDSDECRSFPEMQGSGAEAKMDGPQTVPLDNHIDPGKDMYVAQKPCKEDINPDSEPPAKKQGRGRPKKTANQPAKECQEQTQNQMENEISIDHHLKPIEDKSSLLVARKPGDENTPSQSTPPQEEQESLPAKLGSLSEAATTSLKQRASKSSEQHSPSSKGKVAYRVGLSRRTKIAPLLKMMKK